MKGLTEQLPFDPADPKAALAQLPRSAAVFALYFGVPTDGSSSVERDAEARAEPYIGRTPNLRGRLERLLQPSPKHPRRLQLAGRVRRIEWRLTGSEFESLLLQFNLLQEVYGTKCLERMHLRPPAFVRFLGGNPYPRIVVTHRPSQREADWAYGPFPSRAAAERFSEEALKLFLLRRCTFDLNPDPSYPGCVYSEMKMCLAPCYRGCTDERYAQEAAAVESFLATRGESRLAALRTQRDEASASLQFESAAALHAQLQQVEAVRALAPELVRPLSRLRALILQASANRDEVAVFLFVNGCLRGPAGFSTLGMRIQNEQSGSSSLFAQPVALEPIPEAPADRDQASDQAENASWPGSEIGPGALLGTGPGAPEGEASVRHVPGHRGLSRTGSGAESSGASAAGSNNVPANAPAKTPAKMRRGVLDARLEAVLAALSESSAAPSATLRQGHLALLKRWYYCPEARRTGEVFFPNAEFPDTEFPETGDRWPVKAILRGVGRVAAKTMVPAMKP